MAQRSMLDLAQEMRSAAPLIPPDASLSDLKSIAAGCQACDLWRTGTQTVFGEGEPVARGVFVGEQPGDFEDLAGRPFVGPAGRLLDRALEAADIDRTKVYVTNAVKHFKWEPRGKRRIHMKPNAAEIAACKPWLEAEIMRLRPEVIVALGATAAQALLGSQFRVTRHRGEIFPGGEAAAHIMATVHPSSILRSPDDVSREHAFEQMVEDLRRVAPLLR